MKSKKRKFEEPAYVPPVDGEDSASNGSKWRVEANALHSKTYTGKIDLGTFGREKDAIKRLHQVLAEGYKSAELREILA